MGMIRSGRKVQARICDFTIIQDSREQLPWSFTGYTCDAPHEGKPLIVPVRVKGLKTGDYSIEGMEERVCIERKTLADLYSTLGQGRDRFLSEFERMAVMEFAALIIEADWLTICNCPPERSKLNPKSVFRTLLAWSQRYNVHIHALPTTLFAERVCFRLLERFYLDAVNKDGQQEKQCGEVGELQSGDPGSVGHPS